MSSYTQSLYQIVFGTKSHKSTLLPDRDPLYKYISGLIKNKRCHLYRINGVENHVHILLALHPAVSLASLVKDIKIASSLFVKEHSLFPLFDGWQTGYGAFTYSITEKSRLIEYVKNQVAHHKRFSFREEFVALLQEHEIEFEEKYLW